MAKYDPLEMHLLCLPASQGEITLSFDQVEAIIAAKLPASAYMRPAWWGNEKSGKRLVTRAWRDVGWVVDEVSQGEHWVRFVRRGSLTH